MNLNQITVPCKNIHSSIEFYKNIGLELIVHTHDNYARFLCPIGHSTFSLHTTSDNEECTNIWIYFEVDDVEKKVNELIEKGISIEDEPKEQPWLWTEARLKDPSGNQIIIYHAGDNRINPPWKLKSEA